MLFLGLQTTVDPKRLKEALLSQQVLFGVQGDFTLNRFGDPVRKRFLTMVGHGEFRAVE